MELLDCINNFQVELCYLWIKEDDTKLIKEQGFNFSSKYIFEWEYCSQEKKTIKIKIRKNENYIDKFFGENIINISAIVGENGAGKSTVLSNLNNSLFDLYDHEKIVVLRCNDEFLFFCREDSGKPEVEILNNKNEYINYTGGTYFIYGDIFGKTKSEKIFREKLCGLNFIEYSNSFLTKSNTIIGDIYPISINISTGYLLIRNNSNKKFLNGDYNQIDKLVQYDMLLMLHLLKNKGEYIKEIIKPEINSLIIKTKNIYDDKIEQNKKFTVPIDLVFGDEIKLTDESVELKLFVKKRKDLFEKLNDLNSIFEHKENGGKYFVCTTLMNILYDIFINLKNEFNNNTEKVRSLYQEFNINKLFLEEDINCLDNEKIKQDILKLLILVKESNINIDEDDELKKIITSLTLLEPKLEEINDYNKVKLKISEENNLEIFQRFLELYWTISTQAYYSFSWSNVNRTDVRELSSGENAMFTMYGRLYSVINSKYDANQMDTKDKNLIILMDEPELYLHPEWQRHLIYKLMKFFNEVYSKYNVQLIISSNTPFLLSDLPRENVILLEKKENKISGEYGIEVNKELLDLTFGQNIHTLLKKSFFMKSTMGEFSKNKIDNLIKKLNNDDEKINDEKEEIEKVINMIGEPLIKNKLLEMFHIKLYKDKDIEKIDKEIKRLELMKENLLKGESESV